MKSKDGDVGDIRFRILVGVARALFISLFFVTGGIYMGTRIQEIGQTYFLGPPIDFRDQPWQTTDAGGRPAYRFHPGDTVYVAANFRIGYTGRFRSTQMIISFDRFQVRPGPDVNTVIQPGVYQTNSATLRLPDDLQDGNYRIEGIASLENWLRTYQAAWQTTTFYVER